MSKLNQQAHRSIRTTQFFIQANGKETVSAQVCNQFSELKEYLYWAWDWCEARDISDELLAGYKEGQGDYEEELLAWDVEEEATFQAEYLTWWQSKV